MFKISTHKNIPLVGKNAKPIVTDFFFPDEDKAFPVVIFCHGYKGFKDWGAWALMLKKIAETGYFVVAFNFSHNGGTIEQPVDFPDLEAFGNDNFSIQQQDIQDVINEVLSSDFKFKNRILKTDVALIGHSRGGGAAIIKTANEDRITKLITLASITDYERSFPKGEALENWKKEGVWYIKNGRTQQEMPHYFQFYTDFVKNKEALNISAATKKIKVPHLIIHGEKDTTVTFENAELLKKWSVKSELYALDTDHVFGVKHPWLNQFMSESLVKVTQKIIAFLA